MQRRFLTSFMCQALCFAYISLILSVSFVWGATATSAIPVIEVDPGMEKRSLQKETKSVALRGDDERLRPDSQYQTTIGDTLVTFTGALTFDFNFQDNLNLNSMRKRDRFRWNPRLNLNTIATFPGGFYFFTEFLLKDSLTFRGEDKPMNTFALQVKELFLQTPLPLPIPSSLRIGRQQFFESRRWVLSDTLDGIRLFFDPKPWHFRFSVSTPVMSPDNNNGIRTFDDIDTSRKQIDGLFQTIFDLSPVNQKSKAGFYLLVREDTSLRNEDPIWVGLRTFGKPKFKFKLSQNEYVKQLLKPRIKYWADAAFVAGTIQTRKIRGYGFDLGASYIARKLPLWPYVTLGYAYGSGDSNPKNGTDGNFRQTGFQSNSGKFGGVVNFDYYGILFDPELSNMHILTAGIGFRPLPRTSVDVVYHHYRQASRSEHLRAIDVGGDLNGINKDLGDEIDIIVGSRQIRNLRIRWRNGFFIPGSAFIQQDSAFETRLDFQIGF